MTTRLIFGIAVSLAFVGLAACGSSSAVPFQPPALPTKPVAAVTPSPPLGRMYISDGANPGTIKAYAWPSLPLGNPLATLIGSNGPQGMAFDKAGDLFVANSAGQAVQVFSQPITDGAKPRFTLKPFFLFCLGSCSNPLLPDVAVDSAGGLALDEGGTLYYQHCIEVCFATLTLKRSLYVYPAPVSASSPYHEISFSCQVHFKGYKRIGSNCPDSGFGFFADIAFDRSGNLWAALSDGHLEEYASPATTSAPVLSVPISASGIKFDTIGNLYVGTSNGVDVYRPPFSASMTKAFSINVAAPGYLAFDATGKLLVSSAGKNVLVFAPPFSSASVPVATLPVVASGIAIGH